MTAIAACCRHAIPRHTSHTARRISILQTCHSTLWARAQSTTPSSLEITSILRRVEQGTLAVDEASEALSMQFRRGRGSYDCGTDSGSSSALLTSFANLDHGRAKRTGFPEAVFAAGKTPQQIASILDSMAANINEMVNKDASETDATKEGGSARRREGVVVDSIEDTAHMTILATRVDKDLFTQVAAIPLQHGTSTYHETARIISVEASALSSNVRRKRGTDEEINDQSRRRRKVVVASAGTTDLQVAEEAAVTLQAAGLSVRRVYDVGVAGLHRIIGALPTLRDEDVGCVIVCAGMDGALPSVVAGLVSVPVIAVPTSVGYGASFGGVSAMLTMLNSCAPGVGVVNIDNGFGAAALAYKCMNS